MNEYNNGGAKRSADNTNEVTRERSAAGHRSRARRVLLITVTDILLFAVCLLSFAYFHHVRSMWGAPSGDESDDGGIIVAPRPPHTDPQVTTDAETVPGDDTTATPPDETSSGGTDTDEITTEAETTQPPETEPPIPPHKFESMFLPEGSEPIVTATSYQSHNINITVKDITDYLGKHITRYIVYDIYVRYTENLFTSYSSSSHSFKKFVEGAGDPIVAISGDFWKRNADIAVRNGEVIKQKKATENDFCVLYRDGRMETHAARDLPDFKVTDDVYQIWNFGPALLDKNGHAVTDFGSKNDIKTRHPRSSIGYYEPGHYCFVVVDGRYNVEYNGESVYASGVSLADLAALYESLGCYAAYNLDGGDSAFAYFNGEVLREDYDRVDKGQDQRAIYDIICISELG